MAPPLRPVSYTESGAPLGQAFAARLPCGPRLAHRPEPCSRAYAGYGPRGTRPGLLKDATRTSARATSVRALFQNDLQVIIHISGNGSGDGRVRQAPRAAITSVGGSAQIPRNIARPRAARQCTDRDDPEGHEARLPSSRLGRVEISRQFSWPESLAPHDHRLQGGKLSSATYR
jgi:hypothetical protein